ncbi:DUF1800 domain-containing protein [Singulisphaera acidiphila]|uniref:DUF1800 domain-containing protein n=2 Tax=Singulisphaera acidiphila TaxID=466153 RepID=L0DGN8_SINAD|nr:DUF1800 domain-containing protein [Singulisphaera acidiphila]AGA28544.1 Protein of unknown function (DUF1800) [Singulisphaera acidiphila DSM 18658]
MRLRSGDPWASYVPDEATPWNLRRVVHLHRRAGFAATWDEIQRDLGDGPEASIDRLLEGKSRSYGVPENFAAFADRLAERAMAAPEPNRLKGWWVYRMLFGPDPLTERLTLMWHNHFATSNLKVDDLALMWRQNETLRSLGRAPFGRLLHAMLRDPALLVWLDAPENTQGHPNENLARELLELFTLGIGPYTEDDVKQAARALTGWRIVEDEARLIPGRYDPGAKTILGRTGTLDADGLAALLLDHPATSRRLAWRLGHEFFGEGAVDGPALEALGEGLRAHDLDIGWGVATVLRSRLFFDAPNLGRRIASPIDCLLGAVRALEMLDPAPSPPMLADWCGRLGQSLFYPPNVGGWPGGRSWITTRSALGRANFAAALIGIDPVGLGTSFDPIALAARHGQGRNPSFFSRLLLGAEGPEVPLDALGPARQALVRLLASPEAQRI